MTEAEWMECIDPEPMLEFLRGRVSERRLRLFACACCRRVWALLVHEISRQAVEVAEQYADGMATDGDQYNAYQAADDVKALLPHAFEEDLLEDDPSFADAITKSGIPPFAAEEAAEAAVAAVEDFEEEGSVIGAHLCAATAVGWLNHTDDVRDAEAQASEGAAQTTLLRDIFGEPYRPVTLDPTLRTATTTLLAQAAYDERHLPSGTLDPDRLAVLADALEDAGCDNADILDHLRSPGPHVRGCWVLDLLLNKS